MNLFRAGWLSLISALFLIVLPSSPSRADYSLYGPQTYYLTYLSPDWKESPPQDMVEAQFLMDRLARFGAETKLIGKGVAIDESFYPLPASRLASVKYRLMTPKTLVTTHLGHAQHWQAELQRLGFDVYLGVNEPYRVTGSPTEERLLKVPPTGSSPASFPSHTEWTGVVNQEGRPLPARLALDRDGQEIRGEISFRVGDRNYRAKVRGKMNGNALSFTAYEAIEGRVYIPTVYEATLTGATMEGSWSYAPEQLEDSFTFTLTKP